MSRRELFSRTRMYIVNALLLVIIFVICQIFCIHMLITDRLDSTEVFILVVTIMVELGLLVAYRKYILDIILKDTEIFYGKVVSFRWLPGTKAQEFGRHELTVENENSSRKFIIFPEPLQQLYQTDILIQSLMNHNVRFEYLKRTRCIAAILDIEADDTPAPKKHQTKFEKKLYRQKEMLRRNIKDQQ